MITLSIKSDVDKIAKGFGQLGKELKEKAIAPALNKTIAKGRTEMTRAITSEFAMKATDVRARLNVRKARGNQLQATLQAFASGRKGRSLNLIRFMERKVTLAEARRRGKSGTLNQLRFQIKKGGGMKTISGAFIGNQGRTVFIRDGDARLPIKALSTIDVPQMFNTRRINRRVIAHINKEFAIEFQRALKLIISRSPRTP